MENRWENNENSERLYFLGYKITVGRDLKDAYSLVEKLWQT